MPIHIDLDTDTYETALDNLIHLAGGDARQEEQVQLTCNRQSATFFVRKSDLYVIAYNKTAGGAARVAVRNLNYNSHGKPGSIDLGEVQGCIARANAGTLETDKEGKYFVLASFVIAEAARFQTARVALHAAKHYALPRAQEHLSVDDVKTYSNHTPVLTNWDNIKRHARVTNQVLTYDQVQQYFRANPPTEAVKGLLHKIGIAL